MGNLDKTNIDYSNDSLEFLKEQLNPMLKEYLAERLGNKKENQKKDAFLIEFKKLPIEERKIYRDYVFNIVKESPEFIKDLDNNDDFLQILKLLSSMDKLEVCAGIYNNCNEGSDQTTFFKLRQNT